MNYRLITRLIFAIIFAGLSIALIYLGVAQLNTFLLLAVVALLFMILFATRTQTGQQIVKQATKAARNAGTAVRNAGTAVLGNGRSGSSRPSARASGGSSRVIAVLRVVQGVDDAQFEITTDNFIFGREIIQGCDVAINNPAISGRHGIVEHENGVFYLRDTGPDDRGSTNGTKLNGADLEPNKPYKLQDGDHIILGSAVELIFEDRTSSQPIVQPLPERQTEVYEDSDRQPATRPDASDRDLIEDDKDGDGSNEIMFTLYNPKQAVKKVRYALIIYAHKPIAIEAVEGDVAHFAHELGSTAPKRRVAPQPVQLREKTAVTIVPECEGIEFEPVSLTKKWNPPWVRYNFDFSIPDDYSDEELLIRVSVQVKGIEVAYIKSSCEVIETTKENKFEAIQLPDNPLEKAKSRTYNEAVAEIYRQIFLSYSHDDQSIALKRAEEIEKLLGDKVFIDVKSLRAGEDWEAGLAKAIDEADIFHLLWSENSSKSQYCRYEWEYALKSKCPETRCVGVIRPIYWQDPMPQPPAELAHLHFQKVELE